MLMRRETLPTLLRQRTAVPRTFSNWMDEVFDEVFSGTEGRFFPELNVSETDTNFEVSLELPGMRKEDIEISLDDSVLTISGERKAHYDEEGNGRRYHRIESRFGKIGRAHV